MTALYASTGEKRMKPTGLSHVVLTVTDLERTKAFYQDILGFEVNEYKTETEDLLYLIVGDAWVWFIRHEATRPEDRFSETRVGLDHLAFTATNLEELNVMADKLIAAGVQTNGVETFKTGNRYMAFRDPDNIQLEYWLD
jgi:glyoxylase I family protein